MSTTSLISRKTFFRISGTLMAMGSVYLWDRLVQGHGESRETRCSDNSLMAGVTFFDEFYLFRSGNRVLAFSRFCTHAGCLLNRENEGKVDCPCHGSRFEAETGIPLKGPALDPLKALHCRFDEKNKEWVVRV